MSSEHARLLRSLRKQGFDVRPTGRGRLKVCRGDGPFVVIPKAPKSANRGLQNSIARLRKIGFDQ
jgi:hypothetical protein